MDSSRYDIYIYDHITPGPKPEFSIEQRNESLEKGKDSICKISLPDINFGNGYFCQIFYNENKYNVLIINNQIINREILEKQDALNIKYNYNSNIYLISIKNKILDINSENKKYNFIEINNKNLFALLYVLITKSPLLFMENQGCSKSLIIKLLDIEMKGKISKTTFFQALPSIKITPYQGSITNISQGVLEAFNLARNKIAKKEKNDNLIFELNHEDNVLNGYLNNKNFDDGNIFK